MTIIFPVDFLSDFPGWSTDFDLLYRQEQSRSANGNTYVKDLGSPLWKATYQSRSLWPNELDYWRARLKALENGLQTFRAWPISRTYPIAYPRGSWPTGVSFSGSGQVNSISGKSMSLKALPVGYVVSIGDFVQVGNADLYQALESVTANASGITGSFEVRPYIWPTSLANTAAKLAKPSCVMSLVPDSLSSTATLSDGRGAVTFQAIEAR
ncbi:hypothetical protein [Rhizobium rhizogenes]|uniref:hypothetical protein n=1 Tax=Rhizobium rhizogenes TaxID=359 RepID=UPI0024BD7CF9|nr:hypothetical protein [Rhizobium rhizogenes]MDJ1632671.1 hypothetical protein [Rhizobium rhizogenes]